jgi:hypothetical protein
MEETLHRHVHPMQLRFEFSFNFGNCSVWTYEEAECISCEVPHNDLVNIGRLERRHFNPDITDSRLAPIFAIERRAYNLGGWLGTILVVLQ